MGNGTPKRRKKEGAFDRINKKGLPIPSQKTSWEIYLFLTPPAKKTLLTLHTTTSPHPLTLNSSQQLLSPLTFIELEHHTYNTHRSSCPHHT
jgi:hypothetical protein